MSKQLESVIEVTCIVSISGSTVNAHHLLIQYFVFSFDLSVSILHHLILFGLNWHVEPLISVNPGLGVSDDLLMPCLLSGLEFIHDVLIPIHIY